MIWIRNFIELRDGDIVSLSGKGDSCLYVVDRDGIYRTDKHDNFIRVVDHLPSDVRRGDLISFGYGPDTQYRNVGVFIFDGIDIIELDKSDHGYGFLPRQFTALEFPIGHFSELAYDERYYVTKEQMKEHIIPEGFNYSLHLINDEDDDHERTMENIVHPIEDPDRAYRHARFMIRGRWYRAEMMIMIYPDVAVEYARDVIKGRWYEAEMIILSDADTAYKYARDVIKDRWYEAEMVILSDPDAAYKYAIDVIKGRWFDLEINIAATINVKDRYESTFSVNINQPDHISS